MDDKVLEEIIRADFTIWLRDEMNKLNLDADHFGGILVRAMFDEHDNK